MPTTTTPCPPRRHPFQVLARSAATLLLAAALPAAWALDLQGHRGARGLAPENTLPSFELALKHGVSTLELDVASTRDGVLVVHHDLELSPLLARDAQGRWLDQPSAPIFRMGWAELQAYDVGRLKPGTRYAANYPDQQPLDGTRIPRLQDMFELVQRPEHRQVRLAIEIKSRPDTPGKTLPPQDFAAAVVRAVQAAGLQPRTQILSFDWRVLQAVQRLAPGLPTVYLTIQQPDNDNVGSNRDEPSDWTAGIAWREHRSVPRMIQAAGGAVWSAYHRNLDAAQVKEAQALGLKVLAWTVNDAPTMERLIDMGVDGLVTDRPDIAQQLLRQRRIEVK